MKIYIGITTKKLDEFHHKYSLDINYLKMDIDSEEKIIVFEYIRISSSYCARMHGSFLNHVNFMSVNRQKENIL